MKLILISLLLIPLFAGVVSAQECGPSCPVCSGAGSSDGALLPQYSLMISGISIPSGDEEKAVFNTKYGILK